DECSSVNVTATNTEIHIQKPPDFTISNVTFTNGTVAKPGPLNESISDLEPGVQYIVYLQNITEICCENITTVPSRVTDIHFSNITTTTIILTWNNKDQNAPNYSYTISVAGNGSNKMATSNDVTAVISNLEPGTLYTFTIYPQFAGTKGDANSNSTYTKPSPVTDIRFSTITTQAVNLMWNSSDRNAANYRYKIVVDDDSNRTEYSSNTTAVISDLEPGTLYTFTIYPLVAEMEGDPKNESTYTKPSPVTDIRFSTITTQAVNIMWNNSDRNAADYRYRIEVNGDYPNRTAYSSNTTAVISDLEPGTLYTFTIYPLVAEMEGDPKNESTYTKPSPVTDIRFSTITTQAVNIMWNNSDRNAADYRYRIEVNGDYPNRTAYSSNTTAVISDLEPGTLYTFTIYPLVAEMEGDPKNESTYTRPTAVTDIRFGTITTQAVNLMWNSSDRNAADYRYRIEVNGDYPNRTAYSSNTTAVISDLEPGTLYTFTIYPLVAEMEGDPKNRSTYTKPSPVFDVRIKNYNTTAVLLIWNNTDAARHGYMYAIVTGGREVKTVRDTTATVGELEPGTNYTFEIYSEAGDGETRGDPVSTSIYTIPSSVFNITATDISSVAVSLSWVNMDIASHTYSYRIHISRENGTYEDDTSRSTHATVSQLMPGVNYTFNIYSVAADNTTEGTPDSISLFTKPSAVSSITVKNISTMEVILSWSIKDAAASGYTYRIYVENVNFTGENFTETTSFKTVSIQKLKPGTSYNFSVFAQVNNGKTEGHSSSLSVCTVAGRVYTLNCLPVPKQPELNLSWLPPDGIFNSFTIEISNGTGTLIRTKDYSSEDQGALIKDLSYFVSYTVRIVTHSCGESSFPPQEKTCLTSITDPPVPSQKPALEPTSHNSLKVQFSPFNSIYGPLKAYAVIITSKEMKCSNESLTGTYQDFAKEKTDSYVAYVKDVQNSSNADDYDIEIGDGSTSHGYFNGKLRPLGSYRACVAGFTRIIFTDDSISSRESYVSFSDFSGSVDLPQNPDVITGAVVGCILGAALVAAIVGFIFWKKRRKDGKNNEVPFSPIAILLLQYRYNSLCPFLVTFKYRKGQKLGKCSLVRGVPDLQTVKLHELIHVKRNRSIHEDLRPVGVNQPKFAAELPENKGKNRYNNVLPYDISRVKLSFQNHPASDYINANYVPGYNSKKEFIAAQGSLPNTVQDFWRMIWEKNIHTIVMLTKCIEQGRTKCEEYWPNKQSKNYGDITVAMTSEIVLPEWTIRDFSMEKSDSSVSHPVRQFHFTAWPDHGVPETTDLLISFRHLVQDYVKQNPPSPTLVHCSAGVGRTGTFIAIDRLIHQMEMENTVDVYGVVYDLRMHRPLMVQTEEQYVFLNQCVMDIIKSKKEKKADLIYQNTNAMAIYENFRPSPHLGKANGYHV
ncbi:PREDICTED: receptor-type tyrosine-protein phosphatase eta-like, partial [Gekko japonicus]|uniref:protein-tyrosine-phosphatase n=1 Tax=Gekko japonicus TaxID=146911 RepID=A0ABM1JS79_GEKJA